MASPSNKPDPDNGLSWRPRVRAPARPLPAGTLDWSPCPQSPDHNPFLARILWTVEGYRGVIRSDPVLSARIGTREAMKYR